MKINVIFPSNIRHVCIQSYVYDTQYYIHCDYHQVQIYQGCEPLGTVVTFTYLTENKTE